MNDLDKSIDQLLDSVFAEPVAKAGDNLDVASAAKTTADAAIAAAPKAQSDDARGAGRPKQISDVPNTDEDGKRDGQYDGSIANGQSEVEPDEAKKQAKAVDQTSSAGRMGESKSMKDPRLTKSLTDEQIAEYESLKKAEDERQAKAKADQAAAELKKSEDLKKAELENLVKSAVEKEVAPLRKENEELKKTLAKSDELVKAMASQPVRPKSVTGIESLEKSERETTGQTEFTRQEKLDAAERLVMKKSLPADAVIELENTGTVYNREWQAKIEQELLNPSK